MILLNNKKLNMAHTENIMYQALLSHFVAKRDEAVATLSVYFKNPAGIGEHPQIIEEMVKLIKQLEEANGCIETLQKTFKIKTFKIKDTDEDGK